ncbi:TetR/AcrR family transcriptional regulator [Kutzneria sp. CA-103260]|uniref:TetR/AcrR family transcriptional regulator n=1 Tax=Kutzneria sp. CA-103260 TaxID=2802641 RepID=UPI001BA4F115|nr:TetR family transcriptional regulator [Kutzneria sp. CA-103260]QUQ65678.1 TetR family transcriptional regulator [Kutzneria sp. CA-103260]
MTAPEDPTPRDKLLHGARQLLDQRGRLSDLTLRKLAEALGTSHRMLIYHFGSRDGLLAALLSQIRREQQQRLLSLSTKAAYQDGLQLLDQMFLDQADSPHNAAFFYVLGLAVQDPDTYREFLDTLDDWTTVFTTLGVREGLPEPAARARAHALLWSLRGLLVKAVTTGDSAAARQELREVMGQLGYSVR